MPLRLCRGPLLLIGREREKGTNQENHRTIPEQIGKIPEKSGKSQKGQKRTKKEGQVQIGKPPRLKPPRLAALEAKAHKKKSNKISENPLDGRVSLGHPAGVPAKMPFSVRLW